MPVPALRPIEVDYVLRQLVPVGDFHFLAASRLVALLEAAAPQLNEVERMQLSQIDDFDRALDRADLSSLAPGFPRDGAWPAWTGKRSSRSAAPALAPPASRPGAGGAFLLPPSSPRA
jgi:hypothetical protein